ncbi:MAG: LuxR C-terminal-related transcriptional regulator [Terriglobales bacterium]
MTPPESAVPPTPIRVLVTDSTRMGSQLLADALQRDSQFEIVAVCASAQETLNGLVAVKPDVAVISVNLDEQPLKGLDVCRQARTLVPECRTVLLLENPKKESVLGVFGAGARGIFCRAESIDTLRKCIGVVYTGQVWANHLEMRFVLEAFAEAAPTRLTDARGTVLLSNRQQDIVRCITEGLTNREIAARLKLSEHTVKNYIFRIFDRLGVSTRVEMVLYAFSQRDSQKPEGGGTQELVAFDDLPELERYRRLSEFESALAQVRLAEMHRDGRGTPKDPVSAWMWFLVAERIGSELQLRAKTALDALSLEIGPQEQREAQRRAAKWLRDHDLTSSEVSVPAKPGASEEPEARRPQVRRKTRA